MCKEHCYILHLSLFYTGGILAGVISDRLKKRATTCGMMLLIAGPTVSSEMMGDDDGYESVEGFLSYSV